MAVKTITIDTEAYKRLAAAKRNGESFSQTIKRLIQRPIDIDEWLRRIEEAGPMSPEAIAAVEQQIKQRRKPHNRRRRT